MGADWSHPVLADGYSPVLLTYINGKDIDAITLQKTAPSNLPDGAMAYDRATDLFKEWSVSGGVFNTKKISIAGGGTGAGTAAQARTNLGIGSMGTQDSTAVAITGGSISGITLDASTITSGILALNRGGTGNSLALGAPGTFLMSIGGAMNFDVEGASLIHLNATQLTSGTVPLARLPASLGVVVQVTQNAGDVTGYSVTTVYAVVTNMLNTITPGSASNRVRVQFSTNYFMTWNGGTATRLNVRITRNGTVVHTRQDVGGMSGSVGIHIGSISIDYIDSPATASAIIYRLEAQMTGSGTGEICTINAGASAPLATITCTELTP